MFDVVVIGAGQAGLAAAYHLRRRGLVPGADFLVVDANPGPGGAWRHRWDSLTFDAAHAIHDLPGLPLGTPDPAEPASAVVSRYYGRYEQEFGLQVLRPFTVSSVSAPEGPAETGSDNGPLLVAGRSGDVGNGAASCAWLTRLVISGTGTWDKPYWPYYPGRELFLGRQLHTHDFRSAGEFAGQHVVVVGGGTSADQFLLQLHDAGATTTWATRRPPVFTERRFDAEWGRDVERRVSERTAAGLPPLSVVSATGLPLTAQYRAGIDAGILVSPGMFERITPEGVRYPDGTEVRADAILWATGFRASLDHLAPLRLREPGGGIRMDGIAVARDPRVLLVGYGPSASTLGATRAGRAAALAALAALDRLQSGAEPSGAEPSGAGAARASR